MKEFSDTTRLRLGTGIEVHAVVRMGEDEGRPKCVLLHGNPGSLMDWRQLWPLVSSFADVAAIDLPGFGSSPRPDSSPECLNLERMADHAVAVADALAWNEPVYFLGHSHGGGVAQVAAARRPDRVAGLVLMGTLGTPAHRSYRLLSRPGAGSFANLTGRLIRSSGLQSMSRGILRQVMREIFFPEPVPSQKVESEMMLLARRPEILAAMVHVALGKPCELLADTARHIKCPTLFLHGEADALVPWRYAHAIHERIVHAGGSSRWEIVAGAGHMLIDYQASELVRHISHWCSTQQAAARDGG
jgi:pimeloyl-ACP methyl ester carboxylesterase